MEYVIIKEFIVEAHSAIVIHCHDYLTDGESLKLFYIQIPHIQNHHAKVVKDSFETGNGKRKIFYVRNSADKPIRAKLLKSVVSAK